MFSQPLQVMIRHKKHLFLTIYELKLQKLSVDVFRFLNKTKVRPSKVNLLGIMGSNKKILPQGKVAKKIETKRFTKKQPK